MNNRLIIYFIVIFSIFPNSLFSNNVQRDSNLVFQNASEVERISALLILSEEFQNSNTEKALKYAKEAYVLSENNSNEEGLVKSMLALSQIYWSISDYKKAMEYSQSSKDLSFKLKLDKQLAESYRILGIIYADLDNNKTSSECFYKSLELFEKIHDKQGIEQALGDIGSGNFHQLNFDKALDFFMRSLKMARNRESNEGIARGLNNVAAVYEAINNYEKAAEYFEKANKINRELGNKNREAINNMNLGITYLNLSNYKKSIMYFNKANLLFKELNNVNMQIKCWIGFANYYFVINNEKNSIEYAKKALKKAEALDNKNLIYDATDILHKIFLSSGDSITAYKYLELKYHTKDSLNYIENRINLSKLELEYEFEKREQKNRLEQQKSKLYVSLVIISLLVVLIIIILILVNQRIKTKNALLKQQKLEHNLEIQNREMATNVMSLMKKNEMLSLLSEKLKELKNKAEKQDVKHAIVHIAIELQKTADSEIYKEFEYRFNQIHTGFYDRLLVEFPKLTHGELRLCAFLKLNLSTKDISELTGQLPSSLEIARYRLRKKLGISNTKENLVTFLSKI